MVRAADLGHLVEFCGDVAQFGRFSWSVKIDGAKYSLPLRRAKEFFGQMDSFILFARGQDERSWFGSSECMNAPEMQRVMNQLLVEMLPTAKPHLDFQNAGFKLLCEKNPWLSSRDSSLSDSTLVVVEENLLFVTAKGLADIFSRKCCPNATIRVSSTASLVSSVIIDCRSCKSHSRSLSLCPDIPELNKVAFCVSIMSGRGFAVERFLLWMNVGSGNFQKRNNDGRWMPQLYEATSTVYDECKTILFEAFVLGSSPSISADVAYKRNAKAYQQGLGAALSSLLSICDVRLGKVLAVYMFERRELEKLFQQTGKIAIPCGNGFVETEYAAGGDHAPFELGLQQFYEEAKAACRNVAANQELVFVYANVAMLQNDWTLASIVADALSSGPNTVKRVFGESCKLFIDWWHRRASFKQELSKLEVCILLILIFFFFF